MSVSSSSIMENGDQPPASRPLNQFSFHNVADSTNTVPTILQNMGTIDSETCRSLTLPSAMFATTAGQAISVADYLQHNPRHAVSIGSGVAPVPGPSGPANLADPSNSLQQRLAAPNMPFLAIPGSNVSASNVVSLVNSSQTVPSSVLPIVPSSVQGFVSASLPVLPSGSQLRADVPPAIQFRSLGHVGMPSVNLTSGAAGTFRSLPRATGIDGQPLVNLQINQLLVPNIGSFPQPSSFASQINHVPSINPLLVGTLASTQERVIGPSQAPDERLVSQQQAPSPHSAESEHQDLENQNYAAAGPSHTLNNVNVSSDPQQPSSSMYSEQRQINDTTNMPATGQITLADLATDFEPQPGTSGGPSVDELLDESQPSTSQTISNVFYHKATGKNIHIPGRMVQADIRDDDVSSPESSSAEACARPGLAAESCPTPNNEAESAPDSTTHVTISDFLNTSMSRPNSRMRYLGHPRRPNIKYIQEDNDGVSSTSDDPYLMRPPVNLSLHHFNSTMNYEVATTSYAESSRAMEVSSDVPSEYNRTVIDPAMPSSSGILSTTEYEQVSENEADGLAEQSVPVLNEDETIRIFENVMDSEPGPSDGVPEVPNQTVEESLQRHDTEDLAAACDSLHDNQRNQDQALIEDLHECYPQSTDTLSTSEPGQECSSQDNDSSGVGSNSELHSSINEENMSEEKAALSSDQSFPRYEQTIHRQDQSSAMTGLHYEHECPEPVKSYQSNVATSEQSFEGNIIEQDNLLIDSNQVIHIAPTEEDPSVLEQNQVYQSDCLLSADRLYHAESLISPADMAHLQTSPQLQPPQPELTEHESTENELQYDVNKTEDKVDLICDDFPQEGASLNTNTCDPTMSTSTLRTDTMEYVNQEHNRCDIPRGNEDNRFKEIEQTIQAASDIRPMVSLPNNENDGQTLINIPEVQAPSNMFEHIKVHGDIFVRDDTCLLGPSTSTSVSFPMPVVDPQQLLQQGSVSSGSAVVQRSELCGSNDVVIYVARNSEGNIQSVNIEDSCAVENLDRPKTGSVCGDRTEVDMNVDTDKDQRAGTSQVSSQMSSLEVNIEQSQCIRVDGKKKWKCLQCPKIYTSRHNLVAHVLDHSGIKPFACNMCGKHFKQAGHLYQHILTHGNIKPYMCKVCSRCFTQGSHLKRHMAVHMEKRPHVCIICNHGFVYPSELKSHMDKHSTGVDNTCEQCNEHLDTAKKLKQHMSTVHGNVADLTCKECGKVFPYPSQLKDHMVKHSGQRPFQCLECNMEFLKEHHLKAHRFTHTGLKPFVCTLCTRAFNQKANLQRHMLIHQDKRQYKCEECSRSFTQPQVLKAHMVTHAYDKPFECEECGKKFTRAHNLNGHMHIHKGNKPHVCFCGASFTLKGNLNRHKKEKHGISEDRQCTDEEAAQILNEMSSRKFDGTLRYARNEERRSKGSKKKRKSNPPRKTVTQVNQDEEVTAIWKQGSAPPGGQGATTSEAPRPPEPLSFTNLTLVAPPPNLPTQVPTEIFTQFMGTIPYQAHTDGFPANSYPVVMDMAMPEFGTVKAEELKQSPVQLLQEHLMRKNIVPGTGASMLGQKLEKCSKKGGKHGKKVDVI